MIASHRGHSEIVDKLLNLGADIMKANNTGLTVLGCAAMQGHYDTLRLLYDKLLTMKDAEEIDNFVNMGDTIHYWTPFHLACMGGYENVIKYLVETMKVDILKEDGEHKTGLEHAWMNGHQDVVSYLAPMARQREQKGGGAGSDGGDDF